MKSSRLIQKNSEIFYQINQSPTNRSVSKNTYAFGKSSRFPELKPQYREIDVDAQSPLTYQIKLKNPPEEPVSAPPRSPILLKTLPARLEAANTQ